MAGGRKKETAETGTQAPSLRYREAMEELESILQSIESDEVDIDDLSEKVERAAQLVQLCRSKILATERRVQSVIETFDSDLAPPRDPSEDRPDDHPKEP